MEPKQIADEEDGDLVFIDGFVEGEEDDIDVVDNGSANDPETNQFDLVVGCLEDIMMDEEFELARDKFCRSNCCQFEDTDENKLVYTDIFSQYTALVEGCIEEKLLAALPDFDMAKFLVMLNQRKNELTSDVFELLFSMADFAVFKEMMVAYSKDSSQEAATMLTIECTPMHIHKEDMEDGVLRPDLDSGLLISPAGSGR